MLPVEPKSANTRLWFSRLTIVLLFPRVVACSAHSFHARSKAGDSWLPFSIKLIAAILLLIINIFFPPIIHLSWKGLSITRENDDESQWSSFIHCSGKWVCTSDPVLLITQTSTEIQLLLCDPLPHTTSLLWKIVIIFASHQIWHQGARRDNIIDPGRFRWWLSLPIQNRSWSHRAAFFWWTRIWLLSQFASYNWLRQAVKAAEVNWKLCIHWRNQK